MDNLAFFPLLSHSLSMYSVKGKIEQRAFFLLISIIFHSQLINTLIAFWWVRKSSSPLLSREDRRCRCYNPLYPCRRSVLFEWLHKEHQAPLIKTNYWIPRVMNVYCTLLEVNAASAASEHLSYMRVNEIANGSLMNCTAKQGEFSTPSLTGLALSVVYLESK